MPSSHHYYTLFTILLLSQLHLGLSNFCAQGQYYISSSSTCVDQTIITANIRPTLTPLVYLLVFEGGTVPYGDLTDFSSNVTFTLSSTVETITTNPQAFVASEVDGLSVLQVIILGVDVPYDTTLTVTFADLSNNEGAASVVKSPIQILFPSNKDLSSSDANLVDVITDIDFILEIVWIVVSLLNPYWIIYMDCKLYRETLDLFKQVSVQYQPFLYSFYLANTRKTAGLRIYNFFAMYVFGDSNRNSDWKKYQWTGLGIDGIDTDRIQDTKVLVNSQFFQYNDFALFFDNFGSEMVVLIVFLILALLFETNFRLLKQNSNSTYRTISTGVRQLFWNLLFMTALGSCQTLTYYAAIQFQAFTSEMTTNSKIGFGCAIAAVLLILGGICTYVIISSKKKVFVNKMNHNPQNGPLTFFSWILEFYKAQKLIEPLMILIVIVRSIVFSVIIITLNSNPAIQTGVMLGTTLTCMIAMILVKPFARKLYMVFKLAYEFVILLALIILVVLAVRDNEGTFNTDERSILNVILISLWIAPPVLTIIFGAVGLIMYVKEAKWGTGEKRSVKITPVNEERKVINKKKVFEEHTTVRFADSPTYGVPAEQKPAQIFEPVPSAGVKNFEVPPVSILKPPARAEAMQTNRTEFSDSNANLLQNNKSAHSISVLNPQGNQAPGKLPASSLVLDQQNNATRSPPYADKRNSMFNIGAQRGFGNRIVPAGEQQRPTTINAMNRLEPQGEQQRPHIRNNSTNTIANKSAFSRGGEQPRVRTDVLGIPNRAPFEVMELKLTPQSLRVIDQDGFKEYISKEDGDHGNYVSSRNNMF